MELSRRQTLGVLGIAAVAAAVPASTAKASTPPVFETFALAGKLMAFVNCPIPVASVTAVVFSQDRTAEFGTYPLTLLPGSSPTDGQWEGPPMTGLPLGNYSVDYEAISADGGVAAATRGWSPRRRDRSLSGLVKPGVPGRGAADPGPPDLPGAGTRSSTAAALNI